METLAGARIVLTPRPVQHREAALETALLGHCPGRVRLERLLALPEALDDLRAVGFGQMADALIAAGKASEAPSEARLAGLYHLPISLRSGAEFHDVFPDAATEGCKYKSLLAGNRAWLAQSVEDFFANGGEKLWVVRIPEEDAQAGFLPADDTRLHDVDTLRGLATVLVIPALAVVAMPDLERLQIPSELPDVPRVRLDNPSPRFLPCGADTDDDHRESRHPEEVDAAEMPEPMALGKLLRGILGFMARHRPDMQCLLTLPPAYSEESDSPVVSKEALDLIAAVRDGASGHRLRHIQFLFPYLRGPAFALHTPVGVIAGKQAAEARSKGPWHSIGAKPLVSQAQPYPRLSTAQMLALRENPGVGVLRQRSGFSGRTQLSLDDERLVVPALPPEDYAQAGD